ncbi:DedA family protein [Clostridium tarantellae]|uniref:DedA family protein n=1 Tax=Clostridium tarantellae TaxID=39493 RepID=A0A6I1MNY7_9CLOT|nr:DedA family protein [Clostridium tarantellae]MPQ44493.1 DedA family protein [Clostridium tarantellae]
MNIQDVLNYFSTYGTMLLFIIVFLEYLNLPGLPAGVIMPAAGILVAQTDLSLSFAIFISVVAGVLGSLVLYGISFYGGAPLLEWILKKFPKLKPSVDKTIEIMKKRDCIGIFLCRLIPVLRTIVSIVAGVAKLNPIKFIISSTFGITIWNLVFILAGYFFGDWFLK